MAKVTDIQDKNGATREIQDKDLANRTSQSSIASSDYVLLEDTNGAYHKIAKASFTEAVRGALGSVINSVAKGTDIAKVPVLDSNNDLGMGTLSNLASVLGVPVADTWSDSKTVNINTLSRNGFYWADSSAEGFPDNLSGTAVVVHWRQAHGSGAYGLQILMGLNHDRIFIRQASSENSWSSWKQIQIVT